jgi:hypothetical protein
LNIQGIFMIIKPFTPFLSPKKRLITENVSFAIKGQGLATKTYSCSFDEIRDLEWDELLKLKTDWMKSTESSS